LEADNPARLELSPEAIGVSPPPYGAAPQTRLITQRILRRLAVSRSFSPVAAKKRPNHRPFLSFSIRRCQHSALLPNRETTHTEREDLGELLDAIFKPRFAV
jgi:hypothetical protein